MRRSTAGRAGPGASCISPSMLTLASQTAPGGGRGHRCKGLRPDGVKETMPWPPDRLGSGAAVFPLAGGAEAIPARSQRLGLGHGQVLTRVNGRSGRTGRSPVGLPSL